MTQWLFNTKLKGSPASSPALCPLLCSSDPMTTLLPVGLRPGGSFLLLTLPQSSLGEGKFLAACRSLSQHLTSFGCVIITLDSGTGVHGQASLGITQKGARGTTEPTKVAPSDGDG